MANRKYDFSSIDWKKSNSEISAELGINKQYVSTKRPKKFRVRKRLKWTESQTSLLGKMPDTDIAIIFGVTSNAIFAKRKSLGIPPFKSKTKKP